jgi:effector-binding domain-containing protein/ribosome-associated toxin RatA of RatAB toxin-antitoxin module
MKILKRILIVLVILVALAAIIGLFLPSKMHVEESIVINAKPAKVYSLVDDLKSEPKWSPWQLRDTATIYTYEGPEHGVGSKVMWQSKEMGNGSQSTVEVTPNEKIKRELYFMQDKNPAWGLYTFTPEGEGTKVTWSLDADMGGNPFKHIMAAMMGGMVSKDFTTGLTRMKTLVESMPDAPAANFQIENTTVKAATYLAVRDTASIWTIGDKLGRHFGEIQAAMAKQKLNIAGPTFAIYYSDSKTNWELDACVPVDKAGKDDGNIKTGELKAGNAVVANYWGNYDKMGDAWKGLQAYMDANGKKATGPPWEVYLATPMTEKDTAKWHTAIYFPVE